MDGSPGIPARVLVGRAKLGWLKTLKNCASNRSFTCSVIGNHFVIYKSLQKKSGPRKALRPESPNWQFFSESPPLHAPVDGSTAETNAFGFSH